MIDERESVKMEAFFESFHWIFIKTELELIWTFEYKKFQIQPASSKLFMDAQACKKTLVEAESEKGSMQLKLWREFTEFKCMQLF